MLTKPFLNKQFDELDNLPISIWGNKRRSSVKENKEILLQMAKDGKKRPNHKDKPLGIAICNYTLPSSPSYDSEFDLTIRKIRPDWFKKNLQQTFEELSEIAKSGVDKPTGGHNQLARKLVYMGKRQPELVDKLKSIRPDWFDTVKNKKEQLLEMAKNGADRPIKGAILGNALNNYLAVSRTYYDPDFSKKIRELRPDWFGNVN